LILFFAAHNQTQFRSNDVSAIGHLTRAYGTVRHTPWTAEAWSRLETDRALLVPVRNGDRVQTGEESAAEVLLYGGGRLEIAPESFVTFEDFGESVAVRVAMGRAFLDLPDEAGGGRALGFLRADGTVMQAPRGRRFALSLSAVELLEDAVEVTEFPVVSPGPDPFGNLELRLLAVGSGMGERRPLLVPPIEDRGRWPASDARDTIATGISAPNPLFPPDEANIDVDSAESRKIRWEKVASPPEDPVVSYEVVVRPAPGYEVEDSARKFQVFRRVKEELDAETVNGSGVFLWSVRAVTASGKRSPSSRPRWIELKMPKLLRPPEVIQPKVN